MVEEHQQGVDNMALLDADNQLSALSTTLQQQTLSRQGKDAIGAGSDVQDQWHKAASDIESGLNNRIKDQFRARADHHFSVLNETVQNHARTETQKYDAQTTDSFLQNRLNDAVNHYTDPLLVGQSLAESKDVVDHFAQRNGWSAEQVKDKKTDVVSKIHTGVIDRMLTDGNDLTAQSYYTAHKAELNANDSLQVGKALEVGSTRGESQRQRDKILSTTTNLTDAITAARLIENPGVQEATERLIRQDYIVKAAELRDQREQAMAGATNIVERTHSFNSIPPSVVAAMTVDERKSLRSYADELQGKGAAGIKTDLSTFYNLETMATTPETRDKFLQLDLNSYKSKLSPSDFEEMAKLQGSIRKGDAAAESKLQWTQTKHQIVGNVMNQALIGITKRGKLKDAQSRASFRAQVDNEVERIQSASNKPVTPEQVKQIANELATQHVVERPGMIWGTNQEQVRTFQMVPGEKIVVGIKDVPVAQRAQIQKALQDRGRPVSDQAIVDWYRRYLQTLIPEPE